MTTIACDGKSMAADGFAVVGDRIADRQQKKLFRVSFSIFGVCGASECREAFREWLESGQTEKKPALSNEDFGALELKSDGSIWAWNAMLHPVKMSAPASQGSGHEMAAAAMLCGKDAKGAVEIACMLDINSGGEITVEYLEEPVQAAAE